MCRKSAGLKNITATANFHSGSPVNGGLRAADGVFYVTNALSYGWSGSSSKVSGVYQTLNFNASRYSSIYGNSETVTPESLEVLFCIKY